MVGPLLERWRHLIRRQSDAGSASMASYVVAASLFIISSSYLLQFVVEPPGANTTTLEHVALKTRAEDALQILIGSPGVPTTWDATASSIESSTRLGLIESGTTIRIDAEKFDALGRGRLTSSSSGNGAVDYAEAKEKLGLAGNEFHIRAYPVISPTNSDPFGVSGFSTFRIAYIGRSDGEIKPNLTDEAEEESAAIDRLPVDYHHLYRHLGGDKFHDTNGYLRSNLLPNIGATIEQTVVNQGSGTKFDFYRVESSTYQAFVPGSVGLTKAMALSSDGSELGYSKGRELRAIVGKIDMRGQVSAQLTWEEWVDTNRNNATTDTDCNDYGYVEVSPDNGATWVALTNTALDRSQDCSPTAIHAGALATRAVGDITLLCPACDNKENVLIGFHWVADNDNDVGYGWVVDDVDLVVTGATVVKKTFENPAYDMIIIGSGVDNSAFTPEDIKSALRDYVDKFGGRIFVTGPSSNVQWLDRLFDAGTAGGSGGVSTPDQTHPLLTLPNQLDYPSYSAGARWDFTGSDDAALFSAIVSDAADPNKHIFSVSRQGAWGDPATAEGSVILSSYIPHAMDTLEASRFFANVITYGKFHYLYLDYGPAIPTGDAVASVARSATMNMYRTGAANYTEMAFILYIWSGTTTDTPTVSGAGTVPASAPRNLAATAGNSQVTLTWNPHLSNGSAIPTEYRIYRTGQTASVGNVPFVLNAPQDHVYTFVEGGLTNGISYYYTVRAYSTVEGTPADNVSAIPVGLATPPVLSGLPNVGKIDLSWSAPANNGGSAISGYKIWRATAASTGPFTELASIGANLSYSDVVADGNSRWYKIQAENALGWSLDSNTVAGQAIIPVGPPSLTVTTGPINGAVTLSWNPPGSFDGQIHSGYRIYRADTELGTYTPLLDMNTTDVTFLDQGLGTGATKWYKLSALTQTAEGTATTQVRGDTWDAPPAPTGLVADRLNPLTVRSISWTAPVGSDLPVTHYELWGGETVGTMTQLLPVVAGTTTTHDPGVASTYYYGVKAVSSAGTGAMSNTDS